MRKSGNRLVRFVAELRRRKVVAVAAVYGAAAWFLIEIAETLMPVYGISDWVLRAFITATLVGFPIAIIISWIFDITPAGFERTASLDEVAEEDPGEAPAINVDMGEDRRHVSVLHCMFEVIADDGGTESDPEHVLEALPAIRHGIDELIEQFGGHRLGEDDEEAVLVFGYPTAYDDDAARAVAAGLELIERLTADDAIGEAGLSIVTRAAVHSGDVIVGPANGDDSIRLVGNTDKLAAWLATSADAGQLLVTDATEKLVQPRFRMSDLGERNGPGGRAVLHVYRVDGAQAAARLVPRLGHQGRSIVGRDSELTMLKDFWRNARDGEGRFVLLRGEAGIGKSTLVRGLCDIAAEDPNAWLFTCFCSPYEVNQPFHPVVDYLRGPGLGLTDATDRAEQRELVNEAIANLGLADNDAMLLASLLSVQAQGEASPTDNAEQLRRQILSFLLNMLSAAARQRPTLLVIEDLHWADASTLELIDMLVNERPRDNVLCLFTSRPDFEPSWRNNPSVVQQEINRLPQAATRELVQLVGDAGVPEELVQRILEETEGVPLFAEELTRGLVESGALDADGGADNVASIALPATLKQSLASRIDNLGEARPLLQLCALLGREFDYRLLLAASKTENEKALKTLLSQLVNSGFLFQTGRPPRSSYSFKHILIQENAYESLLKKTRIQRHGEIAALLEEQFDDVAERNPQMLARHFFEAGDHPKACAYRARASAQALASFANVEAAAHARAALDSLSHTAESGGRDVQEVQLLSMLGKALLASRGYTDPTVKETFAKALEISERLDHSPQQFQLVVGLWMYHVICALFNEAHSLARRLLKISDSTGDPPQVVQARYCLGFTCFYRGEVDASRQHMEAALAAECEDHDFASQSASGDDTRIHVRCMLAQALWHLGHNQSALRTARDSVDMARQLGNPYGETFASFMTAMLHQVRGEPDKTHKYAQRSLNLAREKGFRHWVPLSEFMLSWAAAAGTDNEADALAACKKMDATLELYLSAGAGLGASYLGLAVAESWLDCDRLDDARRWLERTAEFSARSGEVYFEPERLRLEARLAADSVPGLRAAIDAANDSGSVALALRAATDLSGQPDAPADAADLLAAIRDSIPEPDSSANRSSLFAAFARRRA